MRRSVVCYPLYRQAIAALATLGLSAGCDSLQGDSPVAVPESYEYPGIRELIPNSNGTYTLAWPSVPFPEANYRVFSRLITAEMDWSQSKVTDSTTFVTDDLRFSPATCFVVRFFTPTADSDTNTTELCTEGFSYTFPGAKALTRQTSGGYTLEWEAAPIPEASYRVFEADSSGSIIPDSAREVNGLQTRVGPFDLGVVKCFVVRTFVPGFPDFDDNTKSLCTDDNKLSKFIGIESVKSTTTGQVQLNWTADDNPDVTGYLVYRGSDFSETFARVDSRLQSSLVISNLEPFSSVSFGVRALTAFGSEDKNTRVAGAQVISTAPAAFAGLKEALVEAPNRVRLKWQKAANVKSYQVFMASSEKGTEPTFDFLVPVAEVAAGAEPTHVISNLGDDRRYSFVVRSVSVFGVRDTNEQRQSIDTPDAGAPKFAGIKSAVVRDGKVVLTWDPPVGEVSWFRIYMAKGSASALNTLSTPIPPEPGAATTAVIGGFQNGADYTFLVRAEDRHGNVDTNLKTATLTAAAQSLPVFFGYVGAPGIDEQRIEVEWNITNDPNVSSYTIDVKRANQPTWGQRFYVSQDLTKKTLKHLVTNLIPDQEYDFLVRSVDRWGNLSSNSTTLRGKTLDKTAPEFTGIDNVVQPPGKSLLTVSWPPSPTRDISYYRVYYSTSALADRTFSQAYPLPVSIDVTPAIPSSRSEFVFENLAKGTKYYFVVRAFDLYDNEDDNRVEMSAVVQNTFPGLGSDVASVESPEGVAGSQITLTASDPDLSDTLTFVLDKSSTCNLDAAPVQLSVSPRIGKQRQALVSWTPPFGYIPAGKSSHSCTLTYTVTDGESTSPPRVLTLTAFNRPPFNVTATINPPPNPALGYLRNQNMTCQGDADDDDGNLPTFTYKWIKGGAEIAGATQPILTPQLAQHQPGDIIQCLVTADDEHDKVSMLSAPITMGNLAPDLLTARVTKDDGPLPMRVGNTAACLWSGRDLDGDTLTFGDVVLQASIDGGVTWIDPELPAKPCILTEPNKRCFGITAAVRRARLRCSVPSVTDGFTTVTTPFVSDPRDVANSTPTLSGVSLSSSTATAQFGTLLTCNATVTDADNDSLAKPLVYTWYRNGSAIPGATAATYSITRNDRGTPLQCEVTLPTDADGFGSAQVGPVRAPQSMTYLNSDPRVDGVEITPALAVTGTLLTCNYSVSDPDGDTVAAAGSFHRIRWFADDGFIKNQIPGENSATMIVKVSARGQKVSCDVTLLAGADGAGSAETLPKISSNEVVPLNSSPVLTSVSVSSASEPARTGTQLTCNYTFSDLDGDSLVSAPVYSWTADGSTITGATAATYTVVRGNRNRAIRCRVALLANADGKGSSGVPAVASNNSIVPVNSDPEILGVTVNVVTAGAQAPYYPGTELSCDASRVSDPDSDLLLPTYKWFRGETEIPGQNISTYIATSADRNQNITCRISLPANADGNGSSAISVLSSSQLPISNRPPEGTFKPLLTVDIGGQAAKDSVVTCELPGSVPNPLDPDNDPVTITYVWRVGSAFLSGTDASGTASGSNMSLAGKVQPTDVVTCVARLSDGLTVVSSRASDPLLINNRAPVVADVPTLNPGVIYASSSKLTPTLTCLAPAAEDADGDALTVRYRFFKRPVSGSSVFNLIGGGSMTSAQWRDSNTVTTDYPQTNIRWLAGQDQLGCEVQIQDSWGSFVILQSALTLVSNSIPEGTFTCNNGINLINAYAGGPIAPTAACQTTGAGDDDGDTLSYGFDMTGGQTTCAGAGSSIVIDPATGVVSGTAGANACQLSIVLRDPSGAAAQVDGVTQRFNIFIDVPFRLRFGSVSVDQTCTLRQETIFEPVGENYAGGSAAMSALALGPVVHSNPGTVNGVISSPVNPSVGGGNLVVGWTANGDGGTSISLERSLVLTDSAALGSRAAGVQRQVGLQPPPAVVSNGSGGFESANCALASCSSSSTSPGSLAAGRAAACAVASGGDLYCWGDNLVGQLGRGSYATASRPVYGNASPFLTSPASQVDLTSYKASAVAMGGSVVLGSEQACAIVVDPANGRANKGVWCWGDNFYGQLGRGTFSSGIRGSGVPQQVSGLSGGTGTDAVAALAVGGAHVCALMQPASEVGGGAIQCWGLNDRGQLGNSSRTNAATPVVVTQFESAGGRAIAAGAKHTCAITNVGRVKCWGDNDRNQLGIVSPNPSEKWSIVPVEVPGLGDDVIGLAAGGAHTCALKQTGEVKCWGSLSDGQIGNGTLGFAQIEPAPTTGGIVTDALAITAGGSHTCALLESGGVKCWGRNSSRQLGANSLLSTETWPVTVQNVNYGAMAVVAGDAFTCILTNDSKVKCFGDNSTFQQGIDISQVRPENAAMPNGSVSPAAPIPSVRVCRELRAYAP